MTESVASKRGKWDSSDEEEVSTKITLKSVKKGKVNVESTGIYKTDTVVSSHRIEETKIPIVSNKSKDEEKKCIRSESYNPLFYGCRSIDSYERLNYISEGTYGVVFRAKCKSSSEIFAIKQVKLGAEVNKIGFPLTALRETNILLSLSHPNIIKIREMVIGSSIDKIFMVMEYCDNDLKYCMETKSQPFSTAEVKQLMLQLLSGVDHMHQKWFIHRDLKTSNLLYSNKDGILKICDFGMARKYESPIAPYTHEVVTLYYRPPEVLLGSKTYSTSLDIWSVACIFAEMLTGKILFQGEGEVDQISKIFRQLGAPSEDKWPEFSKLPNANKISYKFPTRGKLRENFPSTSFSGGVYLNDAGFDLLTRMLHMDPSQRMSASTALTHPWLTLEPPLPAKTSSMPTFRSRHDSEI